jgi:hypothetical protein
MKYHYSSRKYVDFIDWIAENDNPLETNIGKIDSQITVRMVSDCYDFKNDEVSQDIVALRVERQNTKGRK